MAIDFYDPWPMGDADWAALPAIVKLGEDRQAILDAVIARWLTPSPALHIEGDAIENHVSHGGFVLENVAFWDENTEEPIDLGELLQLVEKRFESESFSMAKQKVIIDSCQRVGTSSQERVLPEGRSDLFILIRSCRIDRCSCSNLMILPHFVVSNSRFADGAAFASTQFCAGASFRGTRFANETKFWVVAFGGRADFTDTTFGDEASFWLDAPFGDDTSFQASRFGDRANFWRAQFGDRTNFFGSTFGRDTDFHNCTFGDNADLSGARFGDNANFGETKFRSRANLQDAVFGATPTFSRVRLPDADLRGTTGFIPDETFVRGAHFSSRARDPWSKLRTAYTGPWLIFNILLLIAFVVPFAARGVGWAWLGQTEQRLATLAPELRAEVDRLEPEYPAVAEWARASINEFERHLPGGDENEWKRSNVLKALLGLDRGVFVWLPAIFLVFYNLSRGLLTWRVAPMRDAEERSGITPNYKPPKRTELRRSAKQQRADQEVNDSWFQHGWREMAFLWKYLGLLFNSYGWLIWPHRTMKFFSLIVIALFAWNAVHWLNQLVWLPTQ